MKGSRPAASPRDFLAGLEEPRRSDLTALDALIRAHAPELAPVVQNGMLGYGPFRYRYASGREGDACRIALASNKSGISLYALAVDAHGYVAERYKARFPKAEIGRSCVRFKRLAELDTNALVALIEQTARTPFGDSELRP